MATGWNMTSPCKKRLQKEHTRLLHEQMCGVLHFEPYPQSKAPHDKGTEEIALGLSRSESTVVEKYQRHTEAGLCKWVLNVLYTDIMQMIKEIA